MINVNDYYFISLHQTQGKNKLQQSIQAVYKNCEHMVIHQSVHKSFLEKTFNNIVGDYKGAARIPIMSFTNFDGDNLQIRFCVVNEDPFLTITLTQLKGEIS